MNHLSAITHTAPPILAVKGLRVDFGGQTVLRGVDLDLYPNCVTAIVGPSGCGKTTFLHALNRMTDLLAEAAVFGEIRFDGENIHGKACDVSALRRRIGLIFQQPNPFPLPIMENVDLALREHGMGNSQKRRETAENALREVGLWDEVKDRLGQSALALSGGQRQRLCLARALALEPDVLLLDEPTSALDPIAAEKVEALIARLRKRVTIILVTHNLAQARRLADRVAVFWHCDGAGCLLEEGAADDIFNRPRNSLTTAYVQGRRG